MSLLVLLEVVETGLSNGGSYTGVLLLPALYCLTSCPSWSAWSAPDSPTRWWFFLCGLFHSLCTACTSLSVGWQSHPAMHPYQLASSKLAAFQASLNCFKAWGPRRRLLHLQCTVRSGQPVHKPIVPCLLTPPSVLSGLFPLHCGRGFARGEACKTKWASETLDLSQTRKNTLIPGPIICLMGHILGIWKRYFSHLVETAGVRGRRYSNSFLLIFILYAPLIRLNPK